MIPLPPPPPPMIEMGEPPPAPQGSCRGELGVVRKSSARKVRATMTTKCQGPITDFTAVICLNLPRGGNRLFPTRCVSRSFQAPIPRVTYSITIVGKCVGTRLWVSTGEIIAHNVRGGTGRAVYEQHPVSISCAQPEE